MGYLFPENCMISKDSKTYDNTRIFDKKIINLNMNFKKTLNFSAYVEINFKFFYSNLN
jgi:hypothetical protein